MPHDRPERTTAIQSAGAIPTPAAHAAPIIQAVHNVRTGRRGLARLAAKIDVSAAAPPLAAIQMPSASAPPWNASLT